MTRTSNKASTCGCQTPLIPRSCLSPGSLEVAVASFTIGSFIIWGPPDWQDHQCSCESHCGVYSKTALAYLAVVTLSHMTFTQLGAF